MPAGLWCKDGLGHSRNTLREIHVERLVRRFSCELILERQRVGTAVAVIIIVVRTVRTVFAGVGRDRVRSPFVELVFERQTLGKFAGKIAQTQTTATAARRTGRSSFGDGARAASDLRFLVGRNVLLGQPVLAVHSLLGGAREDVRAGGIVWSGSVFGHDRFDRSAGAAVGRSLCHWFTTGSAELAIAGELGFAGGSGGGRVEGATVPGRGGLGVTHKGLMVRLVVGGSCGTVEIGLNARKTGCDGWGGNCGNCGRWRD